MRKNHSKIVCIKLVHLPYLLQLVSIFKFLNRLNIAHPNQTDDLVILGQTSVERNSNTAVTLAQEKNREK